MDLVSIADEAGAAPFRVVAVYLYHNDRPSNLADYALARRYISATKVVAAG